MIALLISFFAAYFFWIFLLFISFVFWLWMLVDCLVYEKGDKNERLIWVLVVLFAFDIGAIIYFVVRRSRRGELVSSDNHPATGQETVARSVPREEQRANRFLSVYNSKLGGRYRITGRKLSRYSEFRCESDGNRTLSMFLSEADSAVTVSEMASGALGMSFGGGSLLCICTAGQSSPALASEIVANIPLGRQSDLTSAFDKGVWLMPLESDDILRLL